jgi:ATP-binding cassette subfamily B protein
MITLRGRRRMNHTRSQPTNPAVLPRLFAETRPYRPQIIGLIAIDLLLAPLMMLYPVPLQLVVDSVLGNHPPSSALQFVMPDFATSTTYRLLVFAVVLQVVVVLLAQFQELGAYVLRTWIGERLTMGFRARLFRHAQRLSLAFHDSRGVSDSLYRIQYDAPSVQWIAVYGLLQLAAAAATLAAMLCVTVSIDLQLALVAMAVCPPLYFLNRRFNARMRPQYRREAELESSAMGVVQEVLSSFRVVKAFGREDRENQRFLAHSIQTARQRVRLSLAESWFGLLVNAATAAGTAAVLYLGVRGVQAGRLTLGELLLVISYLAQLYGPLKTISQQLATLQSSLAGAERAFELLDQVPDVAERQHARPVSRAAGSFELQEVSFSYDGRTNVLHQVSLSVPAGTSLGIAGRTGSGKTTLINLLMRFNDPSAGRILLDGLDLRDYRLPDLRNQFTIVLQDPVLFSTTIVENIAYARPDAQFEEIVEAAKAANAHEFITALPDGYDTPVGERGMRLSGGERQRISLARAFLKDAPILVLDEPTSSVDVLTERLIMEAMRRLMPGRTTIMIAHRLSTLDTCDVVIELDHGALRCDQVNDSNQ